MQIQPTKVLQVIILLLIAHSALAQETLTLSACQELARTNYPLSKQRGLIESSNEYSVSNIAKGYLPQLTLNGQASYQSEVTNFPLAPGVFVPVLDKDQYRIVAELNQALYNGGNLKKQKEAQEAAAAVESQKLEVDLYKLKERVIQVYFGILLADEQIRQVELLKQDIQLGINKTEAAIVNGTALKSNLDLLQVERLRADQRLIEINALRSAYLQMLGQLINQPLTNATQLSKPDPVLVADSIRRPELSLFEMQKQTLNKQEQLINARNMPRFNLFLQGGYGLPGLDVLRNEFDTWYIGGIRFSWAINGFYTSKKEKAILNVNRLQLDLQKELFVYNTNYGLKQQNSELKKLADLTATDDNIVQLRSRIKSTSALQLENGIITSSDYMREVNAEDQARLSKSMHELQLLLTQYNHLYATGN